MGPDGSTTLCKDNWRGANYPPCGSPATHFYYTQDDSTGQREYFARCDSHFVAGRRFDITEFEYLFSLVMES